MIEVIAAIFRGFCAFRSTIEATQISGSGSTGLSLTGSNVYSIHGKTAARYWPSLPRVASKRHSESTQTSFNSAEPTALRIKVIYRASDGECIKRVFKTVNAARRFAIQMVGPNPELIRSSYAVSRDRIGTIRIGQGASVQDLFPVTQEVLAA